jgi:hypothetical protein
MHACACLCVLMHKRRMCTVVAARQCMRVWKGVFGLVQGHAHCDCCKAMHACACLSVLVHKVQVTVIAAMQCMSVLV